MACFAKPPRGCVGAAEKSVSLPSPAHQVLENIRSVVVESLDEASIDLDVVAVKHLDAARGMDRLAIPTQQGIVLADTRDITHALLDGELVTVFTTKGDRFHVAGAGKAAPCRAL